MSSTNAEIVEKLQQVINTFQQIHKTLSHLPNTDKSFVNTLSGVSKDLQEIVNRISERPILSNDIGIDSEHSRRSNPR